jgi:hypothetical protein
VSEYIAIEAGAVAAQVANLLTAYPELTEDDTLLLDMIEAETDLLKVVSKLVRLRQEKQASIKSLSDYIGDLSERKARFNRGAEGITSLIKKLMDVAGVEKLVLPEATVFMTKARESVTVLDADSLPQGFFLTIRQPNKDAIGKALKAGETIPGAALTFGEAGITFRIK